MKSDICKDCGDKREGQISIHGLCFDCAWKRQIEARTQIKNKKGPIYEKWKARIKASCE